VTKIPADLTEETSPILKVRRCRHRSSDATQCKANAQRDSEFCFFHDPALGKERTAARRAGGIARTRPAVLPTRVPSKELRTAGDVVELLAETINRVRKGELDLRTSNAIGYLSGILLNAIEKSEYEKRLTALEAAVSQPAQRGMPAFAEGAVFEFVGKGSTERNESGG